MPLLIGGLRLDNPFILAPMAGVSDPPFRRLCRRGGAGMVCAEMVSSNALHYGDTRSERMLRTFPDEHPVSMQVFGAEPERLAEAAKKAEAAGADAVDLNCGCPVPKITKTGAGFSLMTDESLFARCVEAMARAVKVPVTVKLRLGEKPGENRAVHFTRLAESAGAAAVAVHARSKEARHSGPPDLAGLAEVAAAVKIPVIGNGGVRHADDARRMLRDSGCAAVMVGQAAMGNPFLFIELAGGSAASHARRFALLREHARLNAEYFGEALGVARLRKFLPAYVRELPGAAEFRGRACAQPTLESLVALVDEYEASLGAAVGAEELPPQKIV
ncbi:MAG: tRNA dihydrouridine synthase DusB [Elusimicrobiota bacterium]|jgi:tRNA-dihydrouridine synthase B